MTPLSAPRVPTRKKKAGTRKEKTYFLIGGVGKEVKFVCIYIVPYLTHFHHSILLRQIGDLAVFSKASLLGNVLVVKLHRSLPDVGHLGIGGF